MSNVILIGYMGCGKSTIGKRISFLFHMPYIDTDKWIEKEQNMTVSRIFDEKGEAAFRDMETACLHAMTENKQDYIIAVGGGLPMRKENRALLGKLGTVVYLRAKPETIYERLKDDTTRPLLQGEDPFGKICGMIKQRGPVYEEAADIIVDVDNKTCETIMREIQEAIQK